MSDQSYEGTKGGGGKRGVRGKNEKKVRSQTSGVGRARTSWGGGREGKKKPGGDGYHVGSRGREGKGSHTQDRNRKEGKRRVSKIRGKKRERKGHQRNLGRSLPYNCQLGAGKAGGEKGR